MEMNSKQREFITLRADGVSFDKIAEKLKKERDEAKGITEQQKERVEKIVQKLKQEDPKPIDIDPAPEEKDIFETLNRLHELTEKGILTEEEFLRKKAELLAKI